MLGSVYVLGLALAVLCGFEWARRDGPGSAIRMATVLLVGAAVSAVIALMQALDLGSLGIWTLPFAPGGRAGANLAQPNNLATLLGLGSLALLLLRERGHLGRCASGALLLLLLLGAATTQSRTALLFSPAIVAAVWLARRRSVPVRTPPWVIALVGAAHWLMVWAWPQIQQAMLLQGAMSPAGRRMDAGRLQAWGMFWDALTSSPWLGFGWLQTASAQLAVSDRHAALHNVWHHAHNVFLELLLWCGYPLGLLLCALIVCWFSSRLRRATSIEAVIGMLMVTIFGIHSLLELPHHYAFFLIPVGWWVGRVEHDMGAGAARGASWRWLPLGLSVAMVVCLLKDYPSVEESYRRALFEVRRIGPPYPGELVPDAPLLPSLTSTLRWVRTPAVAGMSAQNLAALESRTKRFPYPASMVKLAYAWALNGRLPQGVQMFQKIYFIHGLSAYQVALGELHERVQSGDAALTALEAACLAEGVPAQAH
jgi:hypothetical protein